MHVEMAQFMKTCDTHQRMQSLKPYILPAFIPQNSLFDVFSIDFAGPFPRPLAGNCFLFVVVEHVTGWPIVDATITATAEVVKTFMETYIIPSFGTPGTVVSVNTTCITARALQDFRHRHNTKWCTVLACASMSSGRAERMVGTMKRGIEKLENKSGVDWDTVVERLMFWYFQRQQRDGKSPFELLYGLKPKILHSEDKRLVTTDNTGFREVERFSLVFLGSRQHVDNAKMS